jgi:hypothetical protein
MLIIRCRSITYMLLCRYTPFQIRRRAGSRRQTAICEDQLAWLILEECVRRRYVLYHRQDDAVRFKYAYLTLNHATRQQRASSARSSIQTRRAALQPSKRSHIRGSRASRRRPNTTYSACARTLTHAHGGAARSARREPCRASHIIRARTTTMTD